MGTRTNLGLSVNVFHVSLLILVFTLTKSSFSVFTVTRAESIKTIKFSFPESHNGNKLDICDRRYLHINGKSQRSGKYREEIVIKSVIK